MSEGSASHEARNVANHDGQSTDQSPWLRYLRRYFVFVAGTNLIWEFAQIPLYTIWKEGSAGEIVFAAVHCTGGDILIAGACLIGSLAIVGTDQWPNRGYRRVAMLMIASGLGYTIFSEWLNTEIRGSWAYSDIMPLVPFIEAGLSPLMQWILVPVGAFWWMRRT